MYCNRHKTNNCIECAIEAQTKSIVEAIGKNKSTKRPNVPKPEGPINSTIKSVGVKEVIAIILGGTFGVLSLCLFISVIMAFPGFS